MDKNQSEYVREYEDVISFISGVCSAVAQNAKRPDSKPVD